MATPALHNQCFGFEADFTADLRCIPMAVRRKLDLAGIKLKLSHWNALSNSERQTLLHWPDDDEAIEALRTHLLERTAQLGEGQAGSLPRPDHAPWQQGDHWPEPLLLSCSQLQIALREQGWSDLNELERFALVKLSHPSHEHRNLPRALAEFNLLSPS